MYYHRRNVRESMWEVCRGNLWMPGSVCRQWHCSTAQKRGQRYESRQRQHRFLKFARLVRVLRCKCRVEPPKISQEKQQRLRPSSFQHRSFKEELEGPN